MEVFTGRLESIAVRVSLQPAEFSPLHRRTAKGLGVPVLVQLEKVVRERLGWIKPGERVYRVTDEHR